MVSDPASRTASAAWALILAGGAGSRLAGAPGVPVQGGGTDKAFVPLGGMPLVAHALRRMRPQSAQQLISANGDPARFAALACPVVADVISGQERKSGAPRDKKASSEKGRERANGNDRTKSAGPLAGIHAGLVAAERVRERPHWLVSAPVDTPFLPTDLVRRLVESAERKAQPIAVATSGGRTHWAVAAWHIDLTNRLATWLNAGEPRRVEAFVQAQCGRAGPALVEWQAASFDPFFNINTAEDLAAATSALESSKSRIAGI